MSAAVQQVTLSATLLAAFAQLFVGRVTWACPAPVLVICADGHLIRQAW